MATQPFTYPDGRQMRAGVSATGAYSNTVHGRTARAFDLQPDDVRAACQLFADWTGRTLDSVDRRRLAHLIGCGLAPARAVAREYGYRVARSFEYPRGRGIHLLGL